MDLFKTTIAEHPGIVSPVRGSAPKIGEQRIRQLLAKAERFIRQQNPTQALALLQAPGSPPSTWPLLWHPPWYLLAGWALTQQQQPQEARVLLEQGLEVLK